MGNFEKKLEIFDENSIEKLNFYLFLCKPVAKNRVFGNNIIFLQHFFSGSGAGFEPPLSPCVPHCCKGFLRSGERFSKICKFWAIYIISELTILGVLLLTLLLLLLLLEDISIKILLIFSRFT